MSKSRLYTGTGDAGKTSLVGGTRVSKGCVRLEAYGMVDELNSWIGLLCCSDALTEERRGLLRWVQHRLFDIGGRLADGGLGSRVEGRGTRVEERLLYGAALHKAIERLERAIDDIDGGLPALRAFVLPGGDRDAATANIARTVCRRAERCIVRLREESGEDYGDILRYINRLSDLLFALGREINVKKGVEEIIWEKEW